MIHIFNIYHFYYENLYYTCDIESLKKILKKSVKYLILKFLKIFKLLSL